MKRKILGLLVLLTAICPAFVNADQHSLGLEKCAEKENSDGIMICDDGNLNEGDTINVSLPIYTSYNAFDIVLAIEYDHNVLELVEIPKSKQETTTYKEELYNKDGIDVSLYKVNGGEDEFAIPSLGYHYVFRVKSASVTETTIKVKSNMEFATNTEDGVGKLVIKINKKDTVVNDDSIDNSVHTSNNANSSNEDESILNNEILFISALSLDVILAVIVIVLLIKRK